MARVGIITYHFVDNYGAALQAWALQKFIVSLGHEAFIIDYRPSYLTTGGHFRLPVDIWSFRANLIVGYLKYLAIKRKLLGDGGKQDRFKLFHKNYLNIASPLYTTNQSLKDNIPQADVYICGSDQIWNASEQYGVDSSYFLDFVPKDKKRVSYAPSFGRAEVQARFKNTTLNLLREIDAISVRELSGVMTIKDLSGRDALWVPDPTLLLNEGYPEAVSPTDQNDHYIFSYTLRSRGLVSIVEQQLESTLGLEVVSPTSLAHTTKGVPGPLEWLGYIKSAKFVITNSYHGTLFSITFKKPFVFVGLLGSKAGFNERTNSLLRGLNLSDRMINVNDKASVESIVQTKIDWGLVDKKLSRWREIAKTYLVKEIGEH